MAEKRACSANRARGAEIEQEQRIDIQSPILHFYPAVSEMIELSIFQLNTNFPKNLKS